MWAYSGGDRRPMQVEMYAYIGGDVGLYRQRSWPM